MSSPAQDSEPQQRTSGGRRPRASAVAVPALLAALVVVAGGARTWVRGTVSDAVLARSAVEVSGSAASSGVVAAALVAAAGVLAALTGGRVVRWIGATATTLAGALVVALTLAVLLDPSGVVGDHAAEQTGRTGSVAADGSVTVWVPLVLAAGVVLVLAGLAALASVRRWRGLSSRYDAPVDAASSDRATRAESDWDRLSRGEDPT